MACRDRLTARDHTLDSTPDRTSDNILDRTGSRVVQFPESRPDRIADNTVNYNPVKGNPKPDTKTNRHRRDVSALLCPRFYLEI